MAKLDKVFKLFLGDDSKREVPNKELLKYATGVAGQNVAYCLITSYFLIFCTDYLLLDVMLVGTAISISRILDAINDPIVGVIVDRHKFKNGEKLRPFLRIMAIPIGLLTILMFTDVGIPKNGFYIIFIFIVYALWDICYSFQDIAQWGMVSMISTRSEERGRAAQYARVGAMIGSAIPGLIPLILGIAPILGIREKNVFLVAAIVMGLGGMLVSMCGAYAKERCPVVKPQGKVRDDFKLLLKNKVVVLLVIANILQVITFNIPQIYFFKYMVSINMFGQEVSGLTISFIFGLVTGIPGSLAILFTTKFARKVGGMKNVLLIATILNISVRIISFFIGYEGYKIIIMGILLATAGIPNAMMGIASTSLWADSIDYIEWKTGQRNEGAVFSMQNFMGKIASGISILFGTLSLSLLKFDASKYDAGLPQDPVFYKWVWPMYMLAPALGYILYLIPLIFVNASPKQRAHIEEELRLRRLAKKREEEGESNNTDYLDYPLY